MIERPDARPPDTGPLAFTPASGNREAPPATGPVTPPPEMPQEQAAVQVPPAGIPAVAPQLANVAQPVEPDANFSAAAAQRAVASLAADQQRGLGAYQTFGPIGVADANAQAAQINQQSGGTGVAASVQASGDGKAFLVVYNKNQGVIESFRSEPGYTSYNPDYPEVVNHHPVAAFGAALTDIAKGIAAGVEKK